MKLEFAGYDVSSQVFYITRYSYALVNIRPLLPGHVLVCPKRNVDRMSKLSPEEHADLFATVGAVSKSIERFYGAESLNIAIQDGVLAGQTIPHVHVHIIPRVLHDLPNAHEIYKLLNENHIEEAHMEMRSQAALGGDRPSKNRPLEDMKSEAKTLRLYMATVADPRI